VRDKITNKHYSKNAYQFHQLIDLIDEHYIWWRSGEGQLDNFDKFMFLCGLLDGAKLEVCYQLA
jgi:hypothetical protein